MQTGDENMYILLSHCPSLPVNIIVRRSSGVYPLKCTSRTAPPYSPPLLASIHPSIHPSCDLGLVSKNGPMSNSAPPGQLTLSAHLPLVTSLSLHRKTVIGEKPVGYQNNHSYSMPTRGESRCFTAEGYGCGVCRGWSQTHPQYGSLGVSNTTFTSLDVGAF